MPTDLRVSDEDRKEYGDENTPEWVTFDAGVLEATPFDQLHPWEREMGISAVMLIREFASFTALGIKGVVWLAWMMNGLKPGPFEDFNIKTMQVNAVDAKRRAASAKRRNAKGGEADPPARGSSEPSSEKTPS